MISEAFIALFIQNVFHSIKLTYSALGLSLSFSISLFGPASPDTAGVNVSGLESREAISPTTMMRTNQTRDAVLGTGWSSHGTPDVVRSCRLAEYSYSPRYE